MKMTSDKNYKEIKYDPEFNNEFFVRHYRRTKSLTSRDRIIKNNMPMVFTLANKISNITKIDRDDLIQVGALALLESISNYNGDALFSTYSRECVSGQMFEYVEKQYSDCSRYYGMIMAGFNSVGRELYGYYKEYYKEPYLSDVVNVMIEREMISQKQSLVIYYLLHQSFEENRGQVNNIAYDESDDNLKVILNSIGNNLDILFDGLSDDEINIVKLKLGFDDNFTKTFELIGSIYGKSRETIRKTYLNSISRIRKNYDKIS